MAKENQMSAVKIMAKDLVRTRAHVTKFIEMRSHLQSCGLKLQTVKSHHAMGEAMKNTTKAMMKMNKAVNAPAIGKMLDDAMEEPGDAEETDQIVSQVLDEIGIEFNEEVPDAPSAMKTEVSNGNGKVSVAAGGVSGGSGDGGNNDGGNDSTLNDLEARLNNLNKN